MNMLRALSVLSIFLLFLAVYDLSFADENESKNKALKSAKSWLSLVDKGEYGKSWDNTSKLFQDAVPKAIWEQQISAVRSPFGNVKSRKLESKTYATRLPGAPDGEYVIIQFNTVFDYKANAVETVTPIKDSDGEWRVSGYYIK